jgi:DNA-binding response OmpR family regulator
MNRKTVLFVEDDQTIALGVENALSISGYNVVHFVSAEDALLNSIEWDLAIVDVMLPGMDGVSLLQHFKAENPTRPVILLTAKSSTGDVIRGLDGGADDYVTKPFQLGELLARVRARLRKNGTELAVIHFGETEVDLRRQLVHRGGKEIHLTTYENAVLQYLIQHQGEEISRQELLENVWGYSPSMQTRTVDNQILKLRKKIEGNPSRPKHIITVHGIGYRFEL